VDEVGLCGRDFEFVDPQECQLTSLLNQDFLLASCLQGNVYDAPWLCFVTPSTYSLLFCFFSPVLIITQPCVCVCVCAHVCVIITQPCVCHHHPTVCIVLLRARGEADTRGCVITLRGSHIFPFSSPRCNQWCALLCCRRGGSTWLRHYHLRGSLFFILFLYSSPRCYQWCALLCCRRGAAHGCVITTCEAPKLLLYAYILALIFTSCVHCSAAGGEAAHGCRRVVGRREGQRP